MSSYTERIGAGDLRTRDLPGITGFLAEIGDAGRIASLLEGSSELGVRERIAKRRAEGHLAAARGDRATAAERFLEAIDTADRSGRVLDATLARIDAARALVDDQRFDKIVATARRAAEKMKATKLLTELDEIEAIADTGTPQA